MSIVEETIVGECDRAKEMKEFVESKTGVEGLVESGVVRVPRMFIHPERNFWNKFNSVNNFQVPVIDFGGLEDGQRRREAVEQIQEALEAWWLFQMINHGVPQNVMEMFLEATRRFHEQPNEAKEKLYSGDAKEKVRFTGKGDMRGSPAACWRDALASNFFDDTINPESLPMACRYFSILLCLVFD